MLTRRSFASAISMFGAAWAMPAHAIQEKDTLPKPPSSLLLGQAQVEDLLLLMDADKNGKISKAEWMNFMSAEFDRLDTDHNGELDVNEIAQSRLRATRHTNVGK
jgi:EF hand